MFVHLRREVETGAVARFSLAVAIWQRQRRIRSLPCFGFEFPADFFKIPDLDTATPAPSKRAAVKLSSASIPIVSYPDIIDNPEFHYFRKYGNAEDRRASQRAALLGSVLRQFQSYPAEALVLVEAFASTIANEFADVLEQYATSFKVIRPMDLFRSSTALKTTRVMSMARCGKYLLRKAIMAFFVRRHTRMRLSHS